MSRRDASLAFERHATSKLQSDAQLGTIRTMGFRLGEALPSIAAVSNVRLRTMARDEPVGTQLWLAAGTITRVEDAAAIPGTSIEVSDLFFNTPARRKFLKSTTTEFFTSAMWSSRQDSPGLRCISAWCTMVTKRSCFLWRRRPGIGCSKCIAQRSGSGLGRRCRT